MNITIRVFGLELLSIEASTEEAEEYDGSGVTASTPITFAPSYGDARWQPGADFGAGDPEDRADG